MLFGFLLFFNISLLVFANEAGCDARRPRPGIDFSTKQLAKFYKNGGEGFMPDGITPLHFDLTDYTGITK